MSSPRSLGPRSSVEALRKEAKRWLQALRAGDGDARRRFDGSHPRPSQAPGLRDVQLALAREHGLDGWVTLVAAVEEAKESGETARSHQERVADFLDLACLHYGVAPGAQAYSQYPEGPWRRQRAARLLEGHPEVGRASLHTAAVSGDLATVTRLLAERPAAAVEKGGREGWTPLLYVCYGRLPVPAAADNAVAIARALLDNGADPDSHWTYRWEDSTMVWSALCGVIGDGEGGPVSCPPHPAADVLSALLLDRGADPAQDQALYNTMLRGDDDRWLRLLLGRGLSADRTLSWPGSQGTRLLDYLLDHAVEMNQTRRAAALLEHGANPNLTGKRSLYERALLAGSVEMAELLAGHGATRSTLQGRDAFRSACLRLDRATAERLLTDHPEYREEGPALLVDEAAKRDLPDVVDLLLALGVSPDAEHGGPAGRYRALHQAACMNHTAVAARLIERGADVDGRDSGFAATPLAWALHAHMPDTTALLARHTRDVFTLTAGALTDRLATLLADRPAAANQVADAQLGLGLLDVEAGETPLYALPDDEDGAIDAADQLLAAGADPTHRNPAGQTPADKARARGLTDLADLLAEAAARSRKR
jgi:ankyrin repeat protein